MIRHTTIAAAFVVPFALSACTGSNPAPQTALPVQRQAETPRDTAQIPVGLGTLRQEDIAIVLQPEGVHAEAFPLDESVLRTLAPDSYRTLRARLDASRAQIAQRAAIRGIRNPHMWFLRFYGLAPDARFVPTDITVSSGGREFRPFDVIPISAGFGTQRLQPRETQTGLLLFDDGLDVSQPLVVTMGSERNTDWDGILRRIDAERAAIRGRASAKAPHP
ncbi:MAG TPA: hypothetical protein VNS10_03775 [Gemmatimonadaceae bacterium]|jgi:hypothetical protein|nr:hypothetical protein [Gemmatimonadaceae bacterium]